MKITILLITALLFTSCGDYQPWPAIGAPLPETTNRTLIEATESHNKFKVYQSGATLFVTCEKNGRVVAIWSSQSKTDE